MAAEQKYNTIKEYLDYLIAGRESSCVEFKYGKGGFPHKEFWPTYSSFANTDGGVIVIGVKERNGSFYPEGLSAETVEQYEKIFWDSINDPPRSNTFPAVRVYAVIQLCRPCSL